MINAPKSMLFLIFDMSIYIENKSICVSEVIFSDYPKKCNNTFHIIHLNMRFYTFHKCYLICFA